MPFRSDHRGRSTEPVVLESTRARCRRRPIDPGAPRPSELLAVFIVAAAVFLMAGAVAAVAQALTDSPWLHWLSLHLVFLGGVSQLVLGVGQFFTCAFLATSPPSRRFIGLQLGMWNAGVVMVAVGVPLGQTSIVGVGGASVAVGLVLFAAALRGMQRRSLQQARWAVRWYQASAFCLGAGALIGVAMARGAVWSAGSLLGAHLTLNIAGWMGTAIVGTLHTFFPSLTHTRLRLPRLQGPAFVLWTTGVWILAGGVTFGLGVAVVVGWLGLGMASALLSVNLLASSLRAPIKLALPARLIAAGQLCLPIGIAIALETTFTHGAEAPFVEPTRSSLAMLLLMGWVGLTVAGSLLHLLAVLARVRQFSYAMPGPRPVRDQSILGGAGVAVVGLTVGRCVDVPVATVICGTVAILVAGVIGLQLGALLLRAVRPIRRRRSPDGAPSA